MPYLWSKLQVGSAGKACFPDKQREKTAPGDISYRLCTKSNKRIGVAVSEPAAAATGQRFNQRIVAETEIEYSADRYRARF
jgi:hypothetical protein